MSFNRNGFTIIELIAVITILGILSAVILGGYSKTSSSYRMAIATDEFVSQLQSMRNQVRNGNVNCLGVILSKEEVLLTKSEYLNPVQNCKTIPEESVAYADESLRILTIDIDNRKDVPSFEFYFVPPTGEIFVPFDNQRLDGASVVKFTLSLDGTDKQKDVYLLPASGIFTDSDPRLNE